MTTSPTPATRTKVLLVDDHDLIRKGLRHAFERDRQFEVVGEAATAAEGVRQAGALQPDVVIMDLRLPDGSGLEATRALRKSSASMGIVVLTMYAGDDQLFGALEAGASAFVPKTAPADEVVAAARHAASSPSAFTAADLAEAMKRRLAPSGPQLSPREGQVLRLLADGMSVAGIAKQLFVSESTAKTHISKLYEKLGAANRAQALMTALRLGLLEAPGRAEVLTTGRHSSATDELLGDWRNDRVGAARGGENPMVDGEDAQRLGRHGRHPVPARLLCAAFRRCWWPTISPTCRAPSASSS